MYRPDRDLLLCTRRRRRRIVGRVDTVDRVTRVLLARYPELPAGTVRRCVERNHRAFDGCSIRTYLAILVEKAARTELGHAAAPLPDDGRMPTPCGEAGSRSVLVPR